MKNTRKKEIEIARAIGKNVYEDCIRHGFSIEDARQWARVFKEEFLPSFDIPIKLRFARS